MRSIPLGIYVPGDSVIHRLPPLLKLGFLIVFILGTAWIRQWEIALIILVLPAIGYVIARIPWSIIRSQLWPPLPVLLLLGAFQWWQLGWQQALAIVVVIFAAIMMAVLFTLTTELQAMLDAVEGLLSPLRRWGVPADRISLALALTLRLIPLMLHTVNEVLSARRARGAEFSLSAFGTPVIIRSIRRAQAVAEALIARGAAD